LYKVKTIDLLHSSTCRPPVRPASFIEDAFFFFFFFLLYGFGVFVNNKVSLGVVVYFWVVDLTPLINLSVFMPTPISFLLILLCSIS
jgi:hypothetical protein